MSVREMGAEVEDQSRECECVEHGKNEVEFHRGRKCIDRGGQKFFCIQPGMNDF